MTGAAPRSHQAPAAVVVYLAAVLHGLVLVTVPALAPQLRGTLGIGDAAWGGVFVPQMTTSFAGSVLGGLFARRIGLRPLLVLSLLLAAAAEAAILASPRLGYAGLLAATAVVGLAFGASAAPLNAGPPALFPRHLEASVAGTHVAFGLGLAGGPALVAALAWKAPVALLGLALLLMVAALATPLPRVDVTTVGRTRATRSAAFWLLMAAITLYGCAEATFSNWAVVYLVEERALAPADGALALASFWTAMTAGRALALAVSWRIAAARIVAWFPAAMAVATLLVPLAASRASGLALYAAAGLACSAFVPLLLALGVRRFPDEGAAVSAALIAAAGAGLGLGAVLAGVLRDGRTLADVYRMAALYPLLILATLAVLRARGDLRGASPLSPAVE